MYHSRTTSLALVGLFVWTTACMGYREIGPAHVADYQKVQITTTDGWSVEMSDARFISGQGYIMGKAADQYYSIYLSDVSRVEGFDLTDDGEAALKVSVAVLAVAAVVGLVIWANNWDGPLGNCCR